MKKLLVVALLALVGCGAEDTFAPRDEATRADVPAFAAKENTGPNGVMAVLQIKGCAQGTCTLDASKSAPGDGATELVSMSLSIQTPVAGVRDELVLDPLNPVLEYTFSKTGYWMVILSVEDNAGFRDNDVEFARVRVK